MDGILRLPATLTLRDYQKPLYRYLRNGGKRAVAVWHRRAGKDTVALEFAKEAALQRTGVYWHMLPTLRQGRIVVWDGIDGSGQRMLDHWTGWRSPPDGVVQHIRHDEMKLELKNGSIWQVVGSDNYNSLVGANPVGVVFSEYSVADPAAWSFIRPILAENGGWALFIYTPRGRNHGHALYEVATDNDDWFAQLLTVDDTNVLSKDDVDAERRGGMAEELIRQEYYCSFDAPLVGAIYGDQMFKAAQDGRITTVTYDEATEVHTWWDLGHSDATAIWFVQTIGNELHFIDYYQANGEDLPHYADIVKGKAEAGGWQYGDHIWPHDGKAKTLASGGKPLNSMMADLGIKVKVQKRSDMWPGINKVRTTLARCWFDEKKCRTGLEAMKSYRKREDENRSTMGIRYYHEEPLHDWASHAADAFRTGCMVEGAMGRHRAPIEYPADHISNAIV